MFSDNACKLLDEPARLLSLGRYDVLDTPAEPAFDKITSMVRTIFNVPMAAVSLIDTTRQWFKSIQGLDVVQTPRSFSFCQHAIRAREPFIIEDARVDERFRDNPLVVGPPHIVSYMGIPLQTPDGYNLGSLCALDVVPRQFSAEQIEVLRNLAALVMDNLELRLIAGVDSLTGAMTRRVFLGECDKAIARFNRHGTPSALLMFDLDHFKSINDTHGHPAGDEILKAVATTCLRTLRASDAFGRLGGEEFGILLDGTNPDMAFDTAERLRRAIADTVIDGSPSVTVTASFGIANLDETFATAKAWMERSDHALYAAKTSGRNQCQLA